MGNPHMAKKKKHYINRDDFHAELTICKKQNELTRKAIEFFQILAQETSKDFDYQYDADQKDCIAHAVHDCYKYWRGFKECNVVQAEVTRNPIPGEAVVINIVGAKSQKFTAVDEDTNNPYEFKIGETINKTFEAFVNCVNEQHNDIMEGFLDKIKRKFTIMDKLNGEDLSIKSTLEFVFKNEKDPFVNMKKITDDGNITFKKPPNAFSYFTSVVRNGIKKQLSKIYPKNFKQSNKVSLNGINQNNNGFYSI